MVKFLWKFILFVLGIVFLYSILVWMGFDMGNFKMLWNTIIQCIGDLKNVTHGLLN